MLFHLILKETSQQQLLRRRKQNDGEDVRDGGASITTWFYHCELWEEKGWPMKFSSVGHWTYISVMIAMAMLHVVDLLVSVGSAPGVLNRGVSG